MSEGDDGDLRALAAAQSYYRACESVGFDPLTKPYAYIKLNGTPVLYAIFHPDDFGPLRYPSMKSALAMARAEGMSEDFLKTFARQQHDVPDDLRPSQWWEILRIEHVGWQRHGRGTTKGQGTP